MWLRNARRVCRRNRVLEHFESMEVKQEAPRLVPSRRVDRLAVAASESSAEDAHEPPQQGRLQRHRHRHRRRQRSLESHQQRRAY